VKVGLNVTGLDALLGGDVRAVFDFVSEADREGVDIVFISDHLGFDRAAHEVRRRTRSFPFPLEQPWYEPITFLSAVAAMTSRIRLSTSVIVAPLRPALLLAKQLATLDVISGGRVTAGLGVGWQELEFRAAGAQFEGRFGDLDEMVGAMRALWGAPPAVFKGRDFEFADFYSYPLPPQGRDLPILFGFAPTSRNLERIARLGEGWTVDPAHRGTFPEKARELRALFASHGRDPAQLEIVVGQGPVRTQDGGLDADAMRADARQACADGATTVMFSPAACCRAASELAPFLDLVAALKA
jgi:probable F420-dependent oxidoreductase